MNEPKKRNSFTINPFVKEEVKRIPVNVPITKSYDKYKSALTDAEEHTFSLIFNGQAKCKSKADRDLVPHIIKYKNNTSEEDIKARRSELEFYLENKLNDKEWQVKKNDESSESFKERKLLKKHLEELVYLDWNEESKRIAKYSSKKPAILKFWALIVSILTIAVLSFIYISNINMFISDAIDKFLQAFFFLVFFTGLGGAGAFLPLLMIFYRE